MLSSLKKVAQWYKDEPSDAWQFNEITFTQEARDALVKLDIGIEFLSYSAKIATHTNHCYVPSQYFLYAIKIKPLAILLHRYLEVFNSLKEDLASSPQDLKDYISKRSNTSQITSQLDTYSRDWFFRVFSDPLERLGSKDIFNGSGQSTVIRGDSDFFSSLILKTLPIPDASSGILGKLIYELACQPKVYDELERIYSKELPFIISAPTADEILQRLFFILSTKNEIFSLFNNLTSEGTVSAAGIQDLFLLSQPAIGGNHNYFDEPLTYLSQSQKFVHLLKGVLASEEGLNSINSFLIENHLRLEVKKCESRFILRNTSGANYKSRLKGAVNKIYYGAPGTGKSYQIEKVTAGHTVFRTVFHPDTQYSDFVGCLKPFMISESVGYGFRAGPFIEAVITATNNPEQMFSLIIEEINRAPAAAVFGEVFQLLDRNSDGSSIYSIDISDPDMLAYVNEKTQGAFTTGKIKIPSNLSLLATMNSSDQAVMPLDTAFKRRWEFEYLPIDYTKASKGLFKIPVTGGDIISIEWAKFSEIINDRLATQQIPEDRLLGHRFVSETELHNDADGTLKGKIFMYLWDDVLRHGRQGIIFCHTGGSGALTTFGQLVKAFEEKEAVFNEDIEASFIKSGEIYTNEHSTAMANE